MLIQLRHLISFFKSKIFYPNSHFFLLLFFLFSYIFGTFLGYFHSFYASSDLYASTSENWGLSFPEKGKLPQANASIEHLQKYNAYYAENTTEKKLYLTFDAGYENGNTEKILDVLKTQNVPAAFFVVGTYIENEPALIKRMIQDGHIIGNHTYHHPDMSKISDLSDFKKELSLTEDAFYKITGKHMSSYYRPPQGIYNEVNLQMAQDLGYHTFFWSVAYVDWIQEQQPSHEEAYAKLLGRIHPGAIVLLHNTSSTNAEILNDLITKWKNMGYSFHSLDELVSNS